MQRTFIISLILFFVPVMLGYSIIEFATRNVPMSYSYISEYLENESEAIEIVAIGSSQMKYALNPAYMEPHTLNLSAGNQHHDTDFKLLKHILPKLPSVTTVLLEVSYSHFELPHNGPNFWKNSIYLSYYGANTFERGVYFKDRLVYLSNPKFFSKKLHQYYWEGDREFGFNRFGYDTLKYAGVFKDLSYDVSKISAIQHFKINKTPSREIFQENITLFYEMLDYLESKDLQIILCEVPMYKTYLPQRVPEILKRRDSIVHLVKKQYKNISSVSWETDTLTYTAEDYWNHSHLNPKGGRKFTLKLNQILKTLPH